MNTYRIENAHSGVVIGEYNGSSEADALDAMARCVGYVDYDECCNVAPVVDGEIVVTLIS